MSTTSGGVTGFGRAFVEQFSERDVTYNAASIAYYAFVSLIPMLLLAVVIASAVGMTDQIVNWAESALPDGASTLLDGVLSGSTGAGGATVVGIVTLVWSALKVFRGLAIAFARMYAREGPDGIVEQVKEALVVLVAVVVGAAVSVGIALAITRLDVALELGGIDLFGTLASLVLIAALAVVVFPLYFYLPANNVTRREALPGVVVAAVGLVVLQTAFRIYTANAGAYAAYGAIGAVLLLVTLLYFAAIVLLAAVVLNGVLAGRIGRRTT